MTLRPAIVLRAGGLRYEHHATAAAVDLAELPGVSSARVALPAGVEVDASPGDPFELDLDGGDGRARVLTGTVRAVRRGLAGTLVVGADASAALAGVRTGATYEGQDAREVVAALARAAGVDSEADLALPLVAYAADQGSTAAEHAARIAALAGRALVTDAEGTLVAADRSVAVPELALLHGREVVAAEVREGRPGPAVVAVGSGAAGSARAPDALRPSATPLPEGAPAAGPSARRVPHGALRTPGAASDATDALSLHAAQAARRLHVHAFGLPAVRPGVVLEIQDMPAGLRGGPWRVVRVEHRWDGGGGRTRFEAEAAGSDGLPGLLGEAAALAGGLV